MAASPVNARTLLTGAFQDIGVLAQGEPMSADIGIDGLRRLNMMVDGWTNQPLTIPFVKRQVFPLISLKGGPSNPYTMGEGGDFNVPRPTGLTGAGLLLPAGSPSSIPVEIPRAIITDDAFQANQVKDLTSGLFTTVYFNQTYPLAEIVLWPIPDNSVNSLVMYWNQQIAQFEDLSTEYDFPPGYAEAFEYNIAVRMAPSYGRQVDPMVMQQAITSLAWVKRTNAKMSDLTFDRALTHDRRGGYNILTGTGG